MLRRRGWGLGVKLQFQARWHVSVKLSGVVSYCVDAVSVIEAQLWRLTSALHACSEALLSV